MTDDRIRAVFAQMLSDGSWGRYHGPHCDALRAALQKFHGIEHVALCSSGTAAVELALRGVGVTAGDEVILAGYDYKANFSNVLAVGAIPVLVDVFPDIPVLDPSLINAAVTDRTKAVICSHLHGCAARVGDIRAAIAGREIAIVEDACQVPGATCDGAVAGTAGDVGVLSFGGSKLLTAGRGGAVLTNSALISQRIRLVTQRGNDAYPLSEMQAAVLVPQLEQLPARNRKRLAAVERILKTWPSGQPLIPVVDPVPGINPDIPAFYKLAFLRLEVTDGPSRDEFATEARRLGIALDPGFPALHRIHSRRRFRSANDLPNAAKLHNNLLTLHHPVLLQDMDIIDQLVQTLQKIA